jgi:hypothetical protein
MQAAPFLASILRGVGVGVEFFIGGHFIVALGHRVIKTSGRIAETALLLATLWITAANVTPNLVGRLGPGVVSTLNDLSLMAFSLLPEVIVFSAILATYQHWVRFFLDRRRSNPAWIWASLYSLPTASFLIMTILTISSFVSEHGASASQATGLALVIRCLSGWFYGLIELISASIGKPHFQTYTVHQIENSMAELVATTRATLEQQAASIATNTEQRVASQVASIERKIENKVASQIATIESLIETTVASIEPLIESKVASQGASIETLIETRIAPLIANGMMVASTSDGGRSQGITADQFEMLVQLIHRQARTIEQLSSSLSEVKRTVVTEIREIRETRSFPQETPTLSGPQAQTRALPLPEETTVEVSETGSEDGEKPGTRVLRFLQECQARNHKPTLLEIQQACQVAKKTATTYRKSFYGDESSQADEGD